MVDFVTVFAPAKLNLYLHITGKRPDGYHLLDSLVAFADIGDVVEIERASYFSFEISGPFAGDFSSEYADTSAASLNIAVRAAMALAQAEARLPNIRLTLHKNLPLASGLGGGSADAAAVVRGLQKLWDLEASAPYLLELLRNLGADVPVCWRSVSTRMSGTGEILEDAPVFPEIPVVLVNPLISCSTEAVFGLYREAPSMFQPLPSRFEGLFECVGFLKAQSNVLLGPAVQVVPDIEACLHALDEHKTCLLSRLSGSGATCFGLFENLSDAQAAATHIGNERPGWWVRSGVLSGVKGKLSP